jgi:hypothetical protein
MFLPIRPLQSTEVRRVDEVTPRKSVAPRVASPFAETTDGVRLTIGDDARRLAYGQNSQDEQAAATDAPPTGSVEAAPRTGEAVRSSGSAGEAIFQGAALPLAFEVEDTNDSFEAETGATDGLANRALRAFTSSGFAQLDQSARSSIFPEDENERLWASEDSSRVPFEVFQRAVTDAAVGTTNTQGRASSFSPLQPIFSPLENGGAPYGRAVPFEAEDSTELPFGAAASEPQSGVSSTLSKEAVDELIADLSWSLPERYSVRPSGTVAA